MKNIAYLGIFTILSVAAGADDETPFSASKRVMVIGSQTQLFVGDEPTGKAPSGTLLDYSDQNGSWLFIPARQSWVKLDEVVPIEGADEHFSHIIDDDATAEAHHHRGIARQALGLHEQALKDLDEAVKLGLETVAVFINRANVWHSLGNDQNALSELNRAIASDGDNALAFNNRGLIYAAMEKHDQALADMSQAIALDPKFAEAFNNRGVTKVKQGDAKASLPDFNKAIELNPQYAEAFANRGYAAKQLGDFLAALRDYRVAVTLAPNSPQAFNDAAWLIATCPDENLHDGERAVEYATYACKLTSYKNADYIDTLAAAYARTGKFDEAVRTQQQALRLLPQAARRPAEARLQLYRSNTPYAEKS